jgi:hypothetical protein
MRIAVVCVVLFAVLVQLGCGTSYHGSVPPRIFQFKTVVQHDGHGTGGWKVAQVIIMLARLSEYFPAKSTCSVQVGVPVVNGLGPVSDDLAQVQSSRAAHEAGRDVLAGSLPSAMMCKRFRELMEVWLKQPIPGAKVTNFTRNDVPRTRFPE